MKIRLLIKLKTGETICIEGKERIDDSQLIAQRIENEQDNISFGDVGVKRELIDWYVIEDIH